METKNFPEEIKKIVYDESNKEIRLYTNKEEHIYTWEHGIPRS